MICTICTIHQTNAFIISNSTKSRFTQFDRSYKRLTKEYVSSTGEKIIYKKRNTIEVIKFTLECNTEDYIKFKKLIDENCIYQIIYDYFEEGKSKSSNYCLSSDLVEKKIYNADGGLWNISGTFEEV